MKKNIIRTLLIALLCMGMATSALAACNATITASSLNARAGVGTGYQVLAALPKDTTVYYLGVSDVDSSGNTWYKVQYGTYNTGWVSGQYCSLNSGVVTTSYCTANSGDTYIRSNPNLEGSKLGVLKQGQTAYYLGQVMVDSRGVDWFYVNYNGTYGWVSTMYTYLHSETTTAFNIMPTLPTYGATAGTLRAEGGDVYIRSNPNLNGSELTVLKKGYSATYLNERSVDERGVVWFRVNYNGTTGWVSSKYGMLYGNTVSLPPVSSSSSSSASGNYVKASGGKCNVRNQPDLGASVLTSMEKGETASYLGESSVDYRGVVWYKVKFDGMTGWVSSKYASLNGTSSTSSNTSSYGNYVVSNAKSNVRSAPSLSGSVLDTMMQGETASYTGSTSIDDRGVAWYSVRFDGVNGWVSSKYTTLK